MKLVSVEYTPAEAKQESQEANELKAPKYPYGLSLYLDGETLTKLGLDAETLKVGSIVAIAAKAKVTGYSEREYEGKTDKYSDLQICELGIEPATEEKSLATKMYGTGG